MTKQNSRSSVVWKKAFKDDDDIDVKSPIKMFKKYDAKMYNEKVHSL